MSDDAGAGTKDERPPQEPGRPRRSRLRRAARWLLLLVLFLVLPVLAALVLLHLPVGRAAVQAFLERTVSGAVAGQLKLGTLDYNLFRGRVDAASVALDMEGLSLRLERGELRVGPRQGARLRLVRPVVVVRETGKPRKKETATGLAAQPWSVLERLAAAEVVDGRIEMQDVEGATYARIGPLDASMEESGGARPIRLTVGDGVVGAPGSSIRLKPVRGEARLAVGGGRLRIDGATVSVDGSSVDVAGVLERLSPNEGDVTVRASVDGSLVASLSPGTEVTGRVEADASLRMTGGDMTGTARLTTPSGITAQGLGPWVASAQGHFDAKHLVLDSAEVTGYSARITAQGPVAIDGVSPTDVQLRLSSLDVRTLAREAAKTDVPVRAILDGSIRYTTKGLDVDRGRATGSLALRPAPPAAGGPRRREEAPGVPLDGSTDVAVEGRRVRLRNLRVQAHSARVVGDLGITAQMDVDGRFEATLPLAAVRALAADAGVAEPPPEMAGSLTARGAIAGPAKDPTATFQVHGEGVALARAAAKGTVTLDAAARYAKGRVTIEPLSVRSGEGEAVLQGGIPVAAKGGAWDLNGDVRALDLSPLLAAAGVEGRGPLNGQVRIEGPHAKPSARADLDARLTLATSPDPVAVSASGTFADGRLAVVRMKAEIAGGRVEGAGSYDTTTRAMEAKGTAADLQIARLPELPPSMKGIDGRLGATFALAGTPDAPSGEARTTVAGATHEGQRLPDLALVARADGRRLELTGSSSVAAGDPPVAGDAAPRESVFLRGGGSFEADWPIRIEIDVAALPAQALLEAFPATRGATVEARGTFVVDLAARDPRKLHYAGRELALAGKARELEWSTEPFAVEGGREEATITGLRLETRPTARLADPSRRDEARAAGGAVTDVPVGGNLSVEGRVPIAAERTFDLAVQGSLDLAALQAITPENRASGVATLEARVGGTLEAPDAKGTFGVSEGRGRFGGLRVNQLAVKGRLSGREAHLDQASARVLGGTVSASGSFPLARLDGGHQARLHVEAQDVDVSRMAAAGPGKAPDAPSFFVSMSGDVVATAPSLESIRAEGRITRFESVSPEGTIALVAPAAWRLADGRFVQEPIRLGGPLGTLEARAEGRLTGDVGGSAVIAGPFDLRMIGPFVEDTTLAGPARADVRASWSPKAVRLEGGLFVEDGRFTLEQLQFTASQLKGAVRFLGNRATLEATASAGDGTLVASGGMTFGPSFLGPAELKLEAQRIPINYPEGFRGRASGTILVAGDVGKYEVTGDIAVSQAYYTAEFDQRRQSLDRLDYQLAAIRGETSITESLPLAIDVKLVDPLRIRNSQAQLDVVGDLRVGGTLAQPVTSGQVSLLEGGQVTIRRARVRPQEGRVELNGYPSGVPEVDFTGVTQVGGVAMNLRAQGSMDELQLDITSPNRPDLSQSDLISLLLTGRTAQAAASQSGAIVAEELAAALGGALQKGVGDTFLIDVSSDQSLLLDESDAAQRFNVGTRLRQDLAVIYSTRLDGTEQRWVVEWNPRGGRFRLRGIDDRSEGYMVELTDRFSFNVFRRRTPEVEKAKELRKLGGLRLEGTLPLPEKELRDVAGLKVGRRYDPVKLEQAADKVRAKLVERGWRAATVDAVTEKVPDHAGRVGLVLRVTPGPQVATSWTGDDPGSKVREEAVKAWPAYASPEAAAAAVARAARVALQAQGLYDAKVEPSVKTTSDQAEVAFAVTSGVKGSKVELEFDGNTAITDAALAATMPKPGSREFFEALDRSTRLTGEARIAYANAGYLRARVGPPRPRFDAATGVLTVTIPVRERGPSRITTIELPPEVVEAGESAPALRLREGEPFDVEAYLADRDAIAAWYRREGWMEARVRGVLQPAGDDVDVAFAVEAGPRPRRADVRIASAGRTSETLIRRQIEVERGAIIRPQELSQTRARLSEMDVFTSVDVRPVPVDGQPDVRDLEVSYVERPDVTLEYGLRYDFSGASSSGGAANAPSEGKLQVAAGFELANPLGWGWRFKGYTLQTTSLHNYRFGVESSSFLGKRLRTQLLLFDEADDESAIAASFASKVRGFSIQQMRTLLRDVGSRRWHDRLRLQWGYTNKDIQYSEDVGSDVLVAGNRAFLSVSLIGDWRDSLTDPRRGVFWTATTELSRTFLGSDVNYNRLYGQLFAYVPLPAGLVWAQGHRAGVVPGDDPFYLLENRFQAGGPTTVRGFRQNGLGPQFDEDEGMGGQGVLVLNQELRFPIWQHLHGGVFWDAGNSWLLASEFSFRDIRHSVGGGLRFMLPFGPIRIEYAFILNRRKNSDGTYVEPLGRFVFGLGHAF